MARRRSARGRKATPFTSTKCWSRSTPTLASRPRPWPSWTRSSTTSLNASPVSRLVWPTTTSARPSRAARSRRPSVFSCPVNWPSTPSLKAPRLLPNTPAPSRFSLFCDLLVFLNKSVLFRTTISLKKKEITIAFWLFFTLLIKSNGNLLQRLVL